MKNELLPNPNLISDKLIFESESNRLKSKIKETCESIIDKKTNPKQRSQDLTRLKACEVLVKIEPSMAISQEEFHRTSINFLMLLQQFIVKIDNKHADIFVEHTKKIAELIINCNSQAELEYIIKNKI